MKPMPPMSAARLNTQSTPLVTLRQLFRSRRSTYIYNIYHIYAYTYMYTPLPYTYVYIYCITIQVPEIHLQKEERTEERDKES